MNQERRSQGSKSALHLNLTLLASRTVKNKQQFERLPTCVEVLSQQPKQNKTPAIPGVDWLQENFELGEGRESLPRGSNDL